MKGIAIITAALAVISCLLTSAVTAVIQYPPKDTDITADVPRSDTQPVIDGKIEENEYAQIQINSSALSYVVGADEDWNRAKNTRFSAYGAIYGDRFCFALTSTLSSQYYRTECEPKMMWAQTCLLLSFAKMGTTGRSALEIGIRPDGKSYVWQNYKNKAYTPEGSFAAVYENGVLTYEISVPLSAFGAEDDDDFLFCFSISCGDYLNNERNVYIQFGRGISGFSTTENADAGKDASVFPTIRIVKPSETETDHETQSGEITEPPDTSVNIKSAVLGCVLIMAVVTVSAQLLKKRKTV